MVAGQPAVVAGREDRRLATLGERPMIPEWPEALPSRSVGRSGAAGRRPQGHHRPRPCGDRGAPAPPVAVPAGPPGGPRRPREREVGGPVPAVRRPAVLAGHFPGRPVFPGALQIEAVGPGRAVVGAPPPRDRPGRSR